MIRKLSQATLDYLAHQQQITAKSDAQIIRQAKAGTLKGRQIS